MVAIRKMLSLLLFSVFIYSCSNKDKKTGLDQSTPTTGTETIAVDETLLPIIKAEQEVFESIYQQANLKIVALSEREAYRALEQGKVNLVISSRTLTKKQKEFFNAKKLFPKEVAIAKDGIAVIIHPSNTDTCFTMANLRQILVGGVTKWNTLNPKSKLGDMQIVFDNVNSSIIRYLLDTIGNGEKFLPNMSAKKTNEDVIDYVSKNKSAIGFIGVNWVSDRDDTTSMTFLKNIKVAYLSPDGMEFVQPYQAFIATKQYPLVRTIYTVCTEPYNGLASGFVSFLASDRGQRIILKSGLLPATAPLRVVSVREDFNF